MKQDKRDRLLNALRQYKESCLDNCRNSSGIIMPIEDMNIDERISFEEARLIQLDIEELEDE